MKDQINTIREFFLLPVPHSPQDTLEYGRAKVRAEIAVSQIEAAVGEPVAFVTDADVACFGKGAQGEIAALLHRQGKWCHPLFTAAPAAQQPQGEVVVTWDAAHTRILAVTRQDEKGRILKVLAEAPAQQPQAEAVPPGYVLVPVDVLEAASESLGSFVSDHGWTTLDMQAMDNLDAILAQQKGQP